MMSDDEQIKQYIHGVTYPTTKDEIVDYAKSHDANMGVVNKLDMLEDGKYETPEGVEDSIMMMESEDLEDDEDYDEEDM